TSRSTLFPYTTLFRSRVSKGASTFCVGSFSGKGLAKVLTQRERHDESSEILRINSWDRDSKSVFCGWASTAPRAAGGSGPVECGRGGPARTCFGHGLRTGGSASGRGADNGRRPD